MTFLAPLRLLLLLAVAGLVVTYLVLERRRQQDVARFATPALHERLVRDRPRETTRHLFAAGVGLALVAMVLGFARPAVDARVPRDQAIVVLAVDVSGSMAATDIAPDRLQAAVDAAKRFVSNMPDRFLVGLVSFEDTARVLVVPTTDRSAVTNALDHLQLGQGTAAGEGLYAALDTIQATVTAHFDTGTPSGSGNPSGTTAQNLDDLATVVMLSDGATTVGPPVQVAAQEAAQRGVPVTTIAFGTDTGVVNVQGQLVPVPADTAAMQEVADATGGRSFTASSGSQLLAVYDDIQGRVGYTTQTRELAGGFLGAGLLALLAAGGLSVLRTGRLL